MGPRLMSRGKDCIDRARSTRRAAGFNGAAAHEPRKARTCERCLRPRVAASMGPRLMSRGKDLMAASDGDSRHASMGPRLMSRGKGHAQGAAHAACGGFNGAAAHEPRKVRPRNSLSDLDAGQDSRAAVVQCQTQRIALSLRQSNIHCRQPFRHASECRVCGVTPPLAICQTTKNGLIGS